MTRRHASAARRRARKAPRDARGRFVAHGSALRSFAVARDLERRAARIAEGVHRDPRRTFLGDSPPARELRRRILIGYDRAGRGRPPAWDLADVAVMLVVVVMLIAWRTAYLAVRGTAALVALAVERRRQVLEQRAAHAAALERYRREELAALVASAPRWADWCGANGMPAGAVAWRAVAIEADLEREAGAA